MIKGCKGSIIGNRQLKNVANSVSIRHFSVIYRDSIRCFNAECYNKSEKPTDN